MRITQRYDTCSVQTGECKGSSEDLLFLRNVVWHIVLMEEQDGGM